MINYLITAIGIVTFLFLFWRRLREDYVAERIFSLEISILLVLAIGGITADYYFPRWWFWLNFLGVVLITVTAVIRYRIRFFEILEALVSAFLPWLFLIFLKDAAINQILSSLLGAVFLMILMLLYNYISSNYKRFTWYKSGKVGFAGLLIVLIFFVARVVIAVCGIDMLSLGGKEEIYLSGLFIPVTGITLLILSKSQI